MGGAATGGAAAGGSMASGPVVKVDFDESGRQTSEVTEPGYTAWVPTNTASISNTFSGVTLTFAEAGSNGTLLKSDWYKAGVDAPNYARLVGDGLTVDGGEAGAAIQLTITGLAAGTHTLLTYHNNTPSPDSNTFAPIDISVDGTRVVTGLVPTVRAITTAAAASSYLTLAAKAGQAVTVLYAAEMSSSASNKNVMLNGIELNTPNITLQATNPNPADGDEHVDADDGSITMSWTAAKTAVSHDVYFGESKSAVTAATHSSSEFKGNQTKTTYDVTSLYSMKTYYWRIDEVAAGGGVTRGNVWYFRPRHLAFPGAEGYGRFARGGRGGVVVHVTNLSDSGAGSLRQAVENDVGPRTIVFDVGGLITLASRLSLTNKYVTVAGQTAPGKGITIRSAPFGMSGAVDGVIQHIRVRLGAGQTYDGMGMAGSDHSVVDHCSISWTIDEAFSSRNAKNITLQKTLISECLNIAGHQNYPAGTAHGYAGSISGDIGSFHHNLLAHCEGRNWSLAGGLDGNGNYAGRLDIFDTVVYNWGGRTTDGGAHEVNFVNNYYKAGGAATIFYALNAQYDNFPGTQQYYFAGNVMPGHFDLSNEAAGKEYTGTPNGYSPWVSSAFFPSYATVETAADAFKDVLSDVGCEQPAFDNHDQRIITETLNGTYTYKGGVSGLPGLPDNEADVGGFESYPTTNRESGWDDDGDGLPDFWETAKALNTSSANGDFSEANADPDGDGYTNLDDYLAWTALPHYFATKGTAVSIDLKRLFAGYANSPTYSSNSAVAGTASISGSTASYTPTACGLGSVTLSVKDSSGSTMSRQVVFYSSGC
jgi:hypothetical protein